jgi:diaminopimelate dehydrogenase
MEKIRVGIVGYGNLGRGAELALRESPDMELVCVFSRRKPSDVKLLTDGVPLYPAAEAAEHRGEADILILCSGSAEDLPKQGPYFAGLYNTVDSFDTHAKIPDYFKAVDSAARQGGNTSIISVGWDPGIFSVMRLYGEAVLPRGKTYTFWGKGVSQGHSDAVRKIDGVLDARQYTIPKAEAVNAVRSGENPDLTVRQKHLRECFVVAAPNADKEEITRKIVTMPDYFADYDTTVRFITEEELRLEHGGIPHGGFVIRSGFTGGGENTHIAEYSLKLDSNPEFTSSVLIAYARAAYRLSKDGFKGAKTVFDVPPALLSPKTGGELVKELL